MKKLLLLLLTVFLFLGCSPQKRIARIAGKYNLKQYETVIFRDTVVIEPRTYMFQTSIDSVGDFHQELNGTQLYGNVTKDIVTLKVVTDFDTIYIEKPVEIETIKVQTVTKSGGFLERFQHFIFLLFLLGFGGLIIYKIVK